MSAVIGDVMPRAKLRAKVENVELLGDLVLVDGKVLRCSASEYYLLELMLLAGPGIVFSPERFLSELYPNRTPPVSENLVRVRVSAVRRALKRAGAAVTIDVVIGRGYFLSTPSLSTPEATR